MDSQVKRTLLAVVLCLTIFIAWLKLQETLYPPRPPGAATTAPADDLRTTSAQPSGERQSPAAPTGRPEDTPFSTSAELHAPEFTIPNADAASPVTLGDDRQDEANPYLLAAKITPRGGGLLSLTLSRQRNEVAKDKKNPDHDPYVLLEPFQNTETGREEVSFVTEQIRLAPADQKTKQKTRHTFDLTNVTWSIEKTTDAEAEAAVLRTVIQKHDTDLLAIEKTYRLAKGSHHLEISLTLHNLSDEPYEAIVTQRGPVGMKKEDYRMEFRRIVTAVMDDEGVIELGKAKTRKEIFDLDEPGRRLLLGNQHAIWSALANKYFACIVAPLPSDRAKETGGPIYAEYLTQVSGGVLSDDPDATDDMTFALTLIPPTPIQPGGRLTMDFEAFCGPKSEALFETIPEAVDRNYHLIRSADSRWCTFAWLTATMLWLLTKMYLLTGNYGIAIFILVVIVRLVLHPVTKRGQINMMKMQKGMAKLKPKMDAIQEKYKNDKQKLQEAQMKLYREEGINPAGQILGCLPMFLQMPVWIALWTTLNTNVDMRHQPFFWWITDLSSQDALIPFSGEYNIPLISMMMGPITAFNLLPIIMTVTMYAQQKLTQKLTKPVTPAAPKTDKDGKPLPDQMAQQQKMMSFMMIFFGFIFYNFPSGLNLYILTSNLLGMIEQFHIKKHIREKDERGEFDAKKKDKPGRKTLFARTIDTLQKKAERVRLEQSGRPQSRPPKKQKKAKTKT